MDNTKRAPCESCPCGCVQCAWDQSATAFPPDHLFVVRAKEAYGCVKGASVIVDSIRNIPLMQLGGIFHPLSAEFGSVLKGTVLEKDIEEACSV